MNMDTIRSECIGRIVRLAEARRLMREVRKTVGATDNEIMMAWGGWGSDKATIEARGCSALLYFIDSETDKLTDDLLATVEQAAFLIARDVIAPVARDSDEAVVALTGNAYMPPIRSLSDVEIIWLADDSGDVWQTFIEALEDKLAQERVMMESPEFDNMLYVVDLREWEFHEPSEDSTEPDAWLDSANWHKPDLPF